MEDLQETSKELVCTLADAVEARSKETGAHVQRVALICEQLASLIGLDEREVLMIKHASPLHDASARWPSPMRSCTSPASWTSRSGRSCRNMSITA